MKNTGTRTVFRSLLCSLLLLFLPYGLFACDSDGSGTVTTDALTQQTPAGLDAEIFVYTTEVYDGVEYVYISGVTEAGKKLAAIDVPEKYGDSPIVGLDKGCFDGCDRLETLTVHSNITEWGAALFTGCTKLREVRMDYAGFVNSVALDPDAAETMMAATAYDGTLYGANSIVEGCPDVRFVFDDADVLAYFDTDYTWGVYSQLFTVAAK